MHLQKSKAQCKHIAYRQMRKNLKTHKTYKRQRNKNTIYTLEIFSKIRQERVFISRLFSCVLFYEN